jgi:hypothetical protein
MDPDIRGEPHCIYCAALIDLPDLFCDHCQKTLTRGEIVYYPSTKKGRQSGIREETTSMESHFQADRVPCPSCGTLIDKRYNICPRCRQRTGQIPTRTIAKDDNPTTVQRPMLEYQSCNMLHGREKVLIILGALFLLVISAGICISSLSSGSVTNIGSQTIDQIKSNAINVPYEDLFQNNAQYIGKMVKIRGKILLSEHAGNGYILSVATKPDHFNEDILSLNYQGPPFLEGDLIDIWGRVDGLKPNSMVPGNKVMIPEITSNHLELAS